jgi:hypothetical protein
MSDKNSPPSADVDVNGIPPLTSGVPSPEVVPLIDVLKTEENTKNTDNISSSQKEAEKLQDLKSTLLDSAELATRGASLAVKAGVEMHHAADKLMSNSIAQQKINKIILFAFGGAMALAIILFTVMAFRMQSKISQLDAMVLAVGKRVVTMDATIELVASASELIKDVSTKQDELTGSQKKLETRIDESIKATLVVPDPKAKQPEDKNKELIKLMQNLELKIQAQANATKLISGQLQKLQTSLPDPTSFKRELESASRLLKERQTLDAAPMPVPAPVKPKERVVQFPRVAQPATGTEKP